MKKSVRVVSVGEDGSVLSVSGPAIADIAQRLLAEESIFPRMFLSREAERLVRSFNCDAVYSQPVKIPQMTGVFPTVARLPLTGLIGGKVGEETREGGFEVSALAVMREDVGRRDPTQLVCRGFDTLVSTELTRRIFPPPVSQSSSPLVCGLSPPVGHIPSFPSSSTPSPVKGKSDVSPPYEPPSPPYLSTPPAGGLIPSFPSSTTPSPPYENFPPPSRFNMSPTLGFQSEVSKSDSPDNDTPSLPIYLSCPVPVSPTPPALLMSPLTLSQFPSQPPVSSPQDQLDTSAELEDTNLDSFIQSRLEEILPVSENVPKTKFQPPTKQAILTKYYPSRATLPAFLPPVKKPKLDKLVQTPAIHIEENTGQAKMKSFKFNQKMKDIKSKQMKLHDTDINKDEEVVLTSSNQEEMVKILTSCKELVFLMVFREGFSQFRDTTALGSGFGSPVGVTVRVVRQEGEVTFIRAELWKQSCSNQTRIFFWNTFLLHPSARKLVYDGKAFLSSLVSLLPSSTQLPLSLRLVDPIVGCWLLQPDQPVSSFLGCVKAVLPSLAVSSFGSDQQAATHREMNMLSDLAREMFRRLEKVNLWSLFYQLEMRILPTLVSMERRGVCVDECRLKMLGIDLTKQLDELQEKANKVAGKVFNLSSPKQVRSVLYDDLKLEQKSGTMVGKTAGGVKSTCESVLTKLISCHPLPGLILQYRHLAKYKTTYVEGILVHCKMGKVFTCWDQVAAATGRVTSVSPNLQAIPKGDIDIGSKTINLRSPFMPAQGYKFLAADFEQIEFRIFGQLSQDPHLMEAIKQGGDIFKKLAAIWLDKKEELITEDDRDKTKRVVYALMYGAGKNRLSEILSITVMQASTIINSFYIKFSSLKSFNQKVIAMAEKTSYLTSLLGRRRYFPHICSSNPGLRAQSQRQAFNFLIQGTAADIAKTALLKAEENLEAENVKAHLVMMIHDEMVWEVKQKDLITAAKVVKESLETIREVLGADGQTRKMEMKVKISWGENMGSLTMLE